MSQANDLLKMVLSDLSWIYCLSVLVDENNGGSIHQAC
jgi:hypothetical protein